MPQITSITEALGASRFRPLLRKHIGEIAAHLALTAKVQTEIEVVSLVLPFRTNAHVAYDLIPRQQALMPGRPITENPIFRLVFPARGMLDPADYDLIDRLSRPGANTDPFVLKAAIIAVRLRLNPHPSGQVDHNVPLLFGKRVKGMQHKYPQTVLWFPSQGQTCHAYCVYCFRWAQFVDEGLDLKFSSNDLDELVAYLNAHEEVTDLLITGGDAMIMKASVLGKIIKRVINEVPHIQTIRLGTKALGYWPYRWVTDDDAAEMLDLFRWVTEGDEGRRPRQLAVMAHFSHPAELRHPVAQEAIRRIRLAGAKIYMQAPLIKGINDDPLVWTEMWTLGSHLGLITYYMFVERDTGPQNYFEVPLARACEIFWQAFRLVPGLARTVEGPSMSAAPGKIVIDGVVEIGGRKYFVCHYRQARDPTLVGQSFLAEYDETATWWDQLVSASPGYDRFFIMQDSSLKVGALLGGD